MSSWFEKPLMSPRTPGISSSTPGRWLPPTSTILTRADRHLMLGLQTMDEVDRMFDEGSMHAFGRDHISKVDCLVSIQDDDGGLQSLLEDQTRLGEAGSAVFEKAAAGAEMGVKTRKFSPARFRTTNLLFTQQQSSVTEHAANLRHLAAVTTDLIGEEIDPGARGNFMGISVDDNATTIPLESNISGANSMPSSIGRTRMSNINISHTGSNYSMGSEGFKDALEGREWGDWTPNAGPPSLGSKNHSFSGHSRSHSLEDFVPIGQRPSLGRMSSSAI